MTNDEILSTARDAVLHGWNAPGVVAAPIDKPRIAAIAAEVIISMKAVHLDLLVTTDARNILRSLLQQVGEEIGDAAFARNEDGSRGEVLLIDDLPAIVRGLVELANEAAPSGPVDWGLLEIMGHRSHRGRVTEKQQFGVAGVFVEEPTSPTEWSAAFYPGSAIFGFTRMPEHEVRHYHARYTWDRNTAPTRMIAQQPPDYDDEDGSTLVDDEGDQG